MNECLFGGWEDENENDFVLLSKHIKQLKMTKQQKIFKLKTRHEFVWMVFVLIYEQHQL